MGHADVGQAHVHGLLTGVALVEIPDFAGFFLAHHTRQKGGAVAWVDRAHLGADLAEDGFVRTDGQVADGAQHVAATNRKALHAGDHGFGHVADRGVQLFHGKTDGAPTVVVAVVSRLVAACAKRALAGTGQHDAADVAVVTGLVQGLDDLVTGGAAKGIHLFGAVDRDPGHAIAVFVQDVFELHVVLQISLRSADQPCMVRPPETLRT